MNDSKKKSKYILILDEKNEPNNLLHNANIYTNTNIIYDNLLCGLHWYTEYFQIINQTNDILDTELGLEIIKSIYNDSTISEELDNIHGLGLPDKPKLSEIRLYCNGSITIITHKFNKGMETEYNITKNTENCESLKQKVLNYFFGDNFDIYSKIILENDEKKIDFDSKVIRPDDINIDIVPLLPKGGKRKSRKYKNKMHTKKRKSHKKRSIRKRM